MCGAKEIRHLIGYMCGGDALASNISLCATVAERVTGLEASGYLTRIVINLVDGLHDGSVVEFTFLSISQNLVHLLCLQQQWLL